MSLGIRKIIGKNTAILLLALIISAFIYRDSFGSYFFQDDWFTLRISQAQNISSIFQFFLPRTDIIYYRPLGMQIPFFLINSLFGLNPQPYHLIILFTHFINIFLVFFLIRAIFKKLHIALLTAFLYATSAVHFIPMYWSSTYPFVLGPSAFFLSFLLFISAQSHKESKIAYIISIIIFGLGILVNEMVVTLPAVLCLYLILFSKSRNLKTIAPYFLMVAILMFYRFSLFSPPTKESYQMSLGFHIISNLKTYLFWSFNWSEIMTEQMIHPFVFNSLVMKNYSNYAYISIFTFAVLSSFSLIGLFLLVKSGRVKILLKVIFFGLSWFVIGLSPVLLFSQHKFAYYLPISLVGLLVVLNVFYGAVFSAISKYTKIFVYATQMAIVFLWVFTSVITIDFGIKKHWAPRRAKLSKILIDEAKRNYPIPQENMVFVKNSSENKLSLNNQEALKIIYNNDNIITIYDSQNDSK